MKDSVSSSEDREALEDFRRIPGVGDSIARDLLRMGFKSAAEFKGKDPEELYGTLCRLEGRHVDRCMLYVFRCAVYFVSNDVSDPELLKWWNFKDGGMAFAPQR